MDNEKKEKAIDAIIETIRRAVETKNHSLYINDNERKFANQLLSNRELKNWMKEKHCQSLKEFIIGIVTASYATYIEEYYRINSLFKLIYNYNTIYEFVKARQGIRTATGIFFITRPFLEKCQILNDIYGGGKIEQYSGKKFMQLK